jgi:hypothetical protein
MDFFVMWNPEMDAVVWPVSWLMAIKRLFLSAASEGVSLI